MALNRTVTVEYNGETINATRTQAELIYVPQGGSIVLNEAGETETGTAPDTITDDDPPLTFEDPAEAAGKTRRK